MKHRCALFVLGLFLLGVNLPAQAQSNYSYTLIADSNGPLYALGYPSLSNTGTVAFRAGLDAGGVGVFTGQGGALTTIVDTSGAYGTFSSFDDVSINGYNEVAFSQWGKGVFKSSGGFITAIAEKGVTWGSFFDVSINDSGVVAFKGVRSGGGPAGIFKGNGGTVTTIDSSGHDYVGPYFNNYGIAAFIATYTGPPGRIGLSSGAGGSLTRIADTANSPVDLYHMAALNDAGTAALIAQDNWVLNIYVGNGWPMAIFAQSTFNGPASYGNFTGVSINNSGTVAFSAWFNMQWVPDESEDGGHWEWFTGVFTGPNSTADRVIGTGDPLFGSTVTEVLAIFEDSLNDLGQVAFAANLADGRQVVARANPL